MNPRTNLAGALDQVRLKHASAHMFLSWWWLAYDYLHSVCFLETIAKSQLLAKPLQKMMSSDEDETLSNTMFEEPDDYFQPEKLSTYTDYTLLSGQKLHLRLVGYNPLWVPTKD